MRQVLATVLAGVIFFSLSAHLTAQQAPTTQGNSDQSTLEFHGEFFTPAQVIKYTSYWTGERFPDGRPKVADDILDRMKTVTLEEAWATLRTAGFMHQYEDGWYSIHPDQVLVGRALTAVWMPGRPDIEKEIEEQGVVDHRQGGTNAWPVDMLQPRDVYVGDHFGLKQDGPSIGDNVGNAIYARSGNGIVYDGAVRDINGLNELPNFTSFRKSREWKTAQLNHGEHQWADPHWPGAGNAGRCNPRTKWRCDLYPAPISGTSRQVFGTHSS